MWFGKSIMTKLGLVLAMAVPALAADLKPFEFAGVASSSQQDYWEELMKYKVFGEQGILFVGQNIRVTDTVGWFGTANGPFDMSNGNGHHVVGGPIIIGGNLILSNGNDTLSTGPVRVNGDVRLGYDTWSDPNFVRGDQCIKGARTLKRNGDTLLTYKTVDGVDVYFDVYDTAVINGTLYKGSKYTSCPNSVPKYYSDLTIPHPNSVSHTDHAAIPMNNSIAFIDVPKGTGQYDYYVNGLSFTNQSILVIRMPKGGRLTRIFVNGNINFGTAHPKVRIVEMDNDVQWVGDDATGHWDANGYYDGDETIILEHNGKQESVSTSKWHVDHSTTIENKDYAGNLLVYASGKISWGAVTAADSMIGSFIAADSITIEQHMTLAGQLLGKYVRINADFDGSGFRFVPYDNPKVKLPKAADDSEYLIEGIPNTVKIQLDKASKLKIDFNYCFQFEGAADDLTSGLASRADIENSDIPLYNSSTGKCATSRPGSFEIGETSMTNPITLTALKDNYTPEGKGPERLETFKIWIMDLTGATLEDGSHDGYIVLTIKDVGGPQFNDDVKTYNVKENTKKDVEFDSIPIKNVKVDVADADKFTLEVVGSDATLAKTLFNFELIREARNDANVYDTAYIKMSVKTADLNYEALSQTSFELKFRLKNDGTVTDSTIRTINVIDINEAPSITSIYDPNASASVIVFDTLRPKENIDVGTEIGIVDALDPDTKHKKEFAHLTYSIVETNVPFEMKDSAIVVKNKDAMNHEASPNKYKFNVKVTNCEWNASANKYYDIATNPEKCLEDTHEVNVVIQDEEEPPVITCKLNDPRCDESNVEENSDLNTVIHEFDVTDEDKDQYKTFKAELTYADGTPLSLFKALVVPTTTVGTSTLTIVVNAPIDYETMAHTYKVKVVVTDKGGLKDSIFHTIYIDDVNETPSIDSLGRENDGYKGTADRDPFTLYPKENLKNNDPIGVVYASDPDILNEEFRHLTYSIVEDPTNPVPFTMVGNKILVADETKMNHENGVDYTFTVKVENCVKNASTGKYTENCKDTTQVVNVKIQNVPEGPDINCKVDANGIEDPNCKGPYYIAENSKNGTLIHDFIVTDPDVGQIATMSASLVDKKTGGIAGSLFDAVMKDDTLQIVLKDSSKLNYELIDPSYTVIVTVVDADGLKDTIIRVINVLDINEAPVIAGKDTVITIPENLANGDTAGKIPATDPDIKHVYEYGHLEYSILTPNVPFEMDSNRILVINADTLDYESLKPDTVFTFKVQVANCALDTASGKYTGACLYDTAMVSLAVTDVPEKTIIITDCKGDSCVDDCTGPDCHDIVDSLCKGPNCTGVHTHDSVLTLAVKENVPTGYKIINYVASDEDVGTGHKDTLVASFKNTNNSGADALFKAETKKENGVWRLIVSVKDSSKLNYENVKDIHELTIFVKDPDDPAGMGDSIRRIIEVVDVNEKPVIAGKDTTITIPENLENGKVAGTIPASDPDTKHVKEYGHLEYFILGNNIPFKMDSNKIVVTNADTLDYESLKPDTVFTFKVQVANCELTSTGYDGPCLYDTAKVSLAVTDVPEKTIIITDCKGDSCVDDCTGPDCHDIVDSLCKGPNCTGVHTHDSVLTLAVKENVPTGYKIINYVASDEDVGTGHKDTLVASFKNTNNSGADSLFKAEMKKVNGEWRLIVSVKDSSKLDYEKIKASHELTIYVKDPEDPAGMGDSIRRIIEVVDVNEAPKAKDADLKPEENLPKGTVIGKLEVSEPDSKHVKEYGHLEYSIIGKDDSFVFVMDSNKVLVNDPSKMDYELAVHKYTFDVQIANCELNSTSGKYDGACLYDTAKVTVDIQDVNEVPKIIVDGPIPDGHDDSDSLCVAYCDTTNRGVSASDTLTIGVKENTEDSLLTKSGTVLFKYTVVDEDTGHVAGAKVKWVDVSTSIPSVTTKGSDLFNIEYKNGVITGTVKDQKLLDYEKLRNATSRDDPDPEYTMAIIVTDPDGLADTLYRTIRIVDVNEKPLFEVWPITITENNKINDSLGHVEHPSDIDSLSRNPALYDNGFKMTGGDTTLFWLDKDSTDLMRVMLRANVILDCENGEYVCGQDSMYWVELTYGDTTLKTTYADLKVPVKLIDLNEPPTILTDTIGVDENSPKGTVVDTIKWKDIDRFDSVMNFKIVEDPSGCFDIGKTSGVVTVKKDKCAGLDYEKNESITIRVAITDMVNITDRSLIAGDPITITKEIKVNIHDVNEPPSITDKTIAVPESTTVWTVIDTVKATDPDKDPKKRDLTYTIVDGDSTVFMIDPKKGIVILKDTLDYESKKDYVIYVQVDDGEFADTAKVKINVTNVIEQSEVIITKYTNEDTTWNYPDTVYTNKKEGVLTWRQDGEIVSADTTLKKGKNVIVITYKDPSKDLPGKDTVVIMFNDEIPLVEVSANPTHVKAENVFTIVENTGDADTNIYVNKERDSVYVHVKDPANKRDTSFALEVNLEPVKVSDATLKKMNTIADSKIMLDETPSSGVTRTAVNSDTEKRSYVQMIGGDSVTVSYMVTTDGEPIKVPVINSKGKEESVEVITVTYKTKVGDQEVEISYIADAMTGEILAKGPNGELMVQGASSKNSSKSDKDNKESKNSNVSEGIFTVTTVKIDQLGSPMVVSYAVDEKGNMVKNAEGDIGYSVTYSYKNIYGNVATESVFIVLDQTFPTVEILSPITYSIVRSNFVEVKWTVNGIEQDSLTIQGLEKGPNIIVRFYRDKAGNEASDTVSVMMKDSKNVNIAVEQPVTEIDKDKVEEYYSVNPPKKGETFAVSIKNPSTGKEVETLIGGSFKAKEGSGKEPYPGMEDSHLGPTLALDIKLPVIVPKEGYGTVSGLATLDDIVVSDGMIPLEGVDADNATKISVEEYVEKFCEDGVKIPSDISQFNLYDSKLHAKIWVYTSLGSFVDYFNFTQDLNDPSFTDEAGVLNLYFEQKPDKNGFVKADNGKQYATGAYVYKVEATIRSKLRCTLPSADFDAKEYKKSGDGFGPSAKRKGDVIKNNDELLKSFGYRRPKH